MALGRDGGGIPTYGGSDDSGGSDDDDNGGGFDGGGSTAGGGRGPRFDEDPSPEPDPTPPNNDAGAVAPDPVDGGGGSSGGTSGGGGSSSPAPGLSDDTQDTGARGSAPESGSNDGAQGGSGRRTPRDDVADPVADAADPDTPNPIDRLIGGGLERAGDTGVGEAIGAQTDRLYGTDSADGGASDGAIEFLDRRARQINSRVADEIRSGGGAEPARSPAPGVSGLSAAADSPFIRDSAARGTELLNPAAFGRDLVVGSRAVAQGGDFLVDEGPEGVEAAGEAAVDAAQAAPGAAVDAAEAVRDNPRSAAVTGTALVGTLGVGAVGGAAARTGARGVASGARRFSSRGAGSADVTDAVRTGRSDVGTGGVDTILDADTVDQARGVTGPSRRARLRGETSRRLDQLDDMLPGGSDRGQLQLGGQGRGTGRGRGGGETPDAPRDFDRGDDRVSDNLVQQSLNRQQRAERGAVERGDFQGAQDPLAGAGTRRGTISERGEVELTRSTGAVDTAAETATGGTAAGTGSTGELAGAGAAGIGSVSQSTDPTGIAPDPTVSGGADVDPVNDPTSIASTTAVTGTQQVDPASDPTGIDPTAELRDLFGGTPAGYTLLDDAAGDAQADALDGSDPTNIAPSDTGVSSDSGTVGRTGVGPGSDTGTDTDQPPVTDQAPGSDQETPPVTDTPVPPVVDVPPVTDTPTPPGNGTPPGRLIPPGRFGGGTPPRPRYERDDPEPGESRRRGPEPRDEFGVFGRVDAGGPASSYFSETLTALSLGGFAGDRAPAEGSAGEFFGGGPTQAAADAEGDDAVAFGEVSRLFFGAPVLGSENRDSGSLLL